MSAPSRFAHDVMTQLPLFAPRLEQAGAFEVESYGEQGVRLVMREPHFANNVRYMLVLDRHRGKLRAHWADDEADSPRSSIEIGLA